MTKEIEIPEGYEARIEDNIVIIKPKESEDEKIKNEIINFIKDNTLTYTNRGSEIQMRWVDWLEKQGGQNHANKVESKFKVGDWIVGNTNNIYKVLCVIDDEYRLSHNIDDSIVCAKIKTIDKKFHLWTIQDAKDGDMLANEEMIVIFKHFEEPSYRQHIVAYIGLDTSGNIQITDETWTLGIDKAKPATKEQRDLLFQKMHKAGYEWDDEKKELKKIEQKPAWSEEDESWFKETELMCLFFSNDNDYREKFFTWLKSLKERIGNFDDGYKVGFSAAKYNQWKPSEKQLEALWNIIPHLPNSEEDVDTITELSILYDKLKNL